jgi:hypothetical protein
MIMADVFKVVFLVAGALAVLVSYWLAAAALFPAWVARSRDAYEARPGRASLVGALGAVPVALLGAALTANPPAPVLRLAGALLVAGPVLLALAGSAGLALRIGAGLALPADEQAPWRRVWRGGIVLSLTFLLPLVGWLLVFPWAMVSGAGAALLALRVRRHVTPVPVEARG